MPVERKTSGGMVMERGGRVMVEVGGYEGGAQWFAHVKGSKGECTCTCVCCLQSFSDEQKSQPIVADLHDLIAS